ncbi:PREDICTED: ras guanine nucleotide exchange factor Y-like [Dufourea novaeangliae]|uniref:ras guanine nucleotide exchange factor Y-like n=1 Tax=Dufourea novaeangliae TaxID=178035 RepID=UPI000767A93C|nr:PREDICTED: ras guanine nucleotide exchange factor Y-like [Dufourea novaeangliae]
MSLEWFYVTLTALMVWMCCFESTSMGGPLPENITVLPSRKFLKSSVVTTVSIVGKRDNGKNRDDHTTADSNNRSSAAANDINVYRLPPSPANLLKPDGFKFYTYNERGDMITKQMTLQEIQALIASGGPDHSNAEIQEPQKAEDILTGGKKVMDVVERVQNVLKSAMNKPSTLTGIISNSVPEKANVEWSNILPVILAGDKHGDNVINNTHHAEEVTTVTPPVFTSTLRNDPIPDSLKSNKTESSSIEGANNDNIKFPQQTTMSTVITSDTTTSYTEKLMIPVAVITAEQKPQTWQYTTESPVFQKITEISSSADVPKENYNDNNNNHHLPSSGYVNSLPSNGSSSISSELTKTNYGGVDSISTVADTKTSYVVYSLNSAESKTTTVATDNWEKENLNKNGHDSIMELNKLSETTELSNESFATTAVYSPGMFVTNTGALSSSSSSSTVSSIESSRIPPDDAVTSKPSDLQYTPPSTSLPMELVNSLSSMIDQVSEDSASFVLSSSSDLGEVLPHHEIDENKRENDSEIRTSAATSIINATTELPPIYGEELLSEDAQDAFEECTEESVRGTTSTKLEVDQNRRTTTLTVLPVSFVNFPSANLTRPEEMINSFYITTAVGNSRSTLNPLSVTDTTPMVSMEEPSGITANLISVFTSSNEMHSAPVVFETTTVKTTVLQASDSTKKTTLTGLYDSASNVSNVEKPSTKIESAALVESILATTSTATNIPVTVALDLPNIPSGNLPTKTLASELIAGFGLIGSSTMDDGTSYDTKKATSLIEEPGPINVTSSTNQSSVALKLETQSSAFVTETAEKDRWTTKESGSRNESGTRNNSSMNENIYAELIRPSNLPEAVAVTLETTDRAVSCVTHTDMEFDQVENEQTIQTTDSSVLDDVITTSVDITVTDRSESYSDDIKFSEHTFDLDSVTTITNTESNTWFDSQKPMQVGASNVDGPVETRVVVPTKPEGILVEAGLKKEDDTNMVTNSNGSIGISSTELNSNVYDKFSTNTNESSLTNANTTVDVRLKQQTNETIADSNTFVTDYSMDADKSRNDSQENTIKTNHLPTGSQESESNVTTHSVPSTNQTYTSSEYSSSSKTNKTDHIHTENKWQRITLHETVPTQSTKFVASVTKNPSSPQPLSAMMMMMMIPTSTYETNSTEGETRYPTIPMTEAGTTVTLNSSKNTGGLDTSTKNASIDIVNFSRLCNELAFKFWIAANKGLSTGRSLALSPFGMVSLLAMIFLGARGSTSDQMNEVLGLDNVATFNPHLIFQNVTDAVSLARHQGIANAAFVRELFADKVKVRKLLPFYKEQAQQFYEGLVAEVNYATISDLARRRTNLLIRKQTGGRIRDFVKSNAVPLRSPLAAISANVFQTDCNTSSASTTGRDGELYFAISSAHRLRKLIPVPATVWRSNVLAGYEPSLDATAISLGGIDKLVSTIFLLPGQQGHAAPGDTLDRLEQRLVKGAHQDGTWNKLLKVLIPRRGLELQIPKFSHRSVVNATAALKRMGLDQLFSNDADFKGINGIGNRLFLSDVLQMNLFSTCGDENTANGRHHVEIYPASPSSRISSNYDNEYPTSEVHGELTSGYSITQPPFIFRSKNYRTVSTSGGVTKNSEKQTEDRPRLKLDQPFLYFVRHNPTGLILHMGRFNPRLL